MQIILVAGRARSGKTYVAHELKNILESNNKKVIITEYSKYVKLFAKDILGWDMISEPKPRTFLQDLGNRLREYYGECYFVKRMKEDILVYEKYADYLIISDVRMPHEISDLEGFKPIKIKVINDYLKTDLSEEELAHITEHALDNYDNFDYILKNKDEKEIKEILENIVKEIEL